ncbi:MAG: flagellar filament capping protein FliD [Veillonellales bacterium]
MSGGIYGLSGSGLDIDALVKKLMTAQRTGENTLIQKKTVVQWQKDAYNKVYDDINDFRNTIYQYKLHGTLNPNKVSSSNEAVVKATAGASAPEVSHTMTVTQLADGVKLTSSASLATPGTTVDKTSIATQFYSGMAVADIPKSIITISNGSASATIKVDPTGSLNDFVNQINGAHLNIYASYDSTLDRVFLGTTQPGASADISFAGSNAAGLSFLTDKLKLPAAMVPTGATIASSGTVKATTNIDPANQISTWFPTIADSTLKLTNSLTGKTESITINSTDTLKDVMSRINSGNNVMAAFDADTGQFSLSPSGLISMAKGEKLSSTATLSAAAGSSIASQFYQGMASADISPISITIGNGVNSKTINVNANGTLDDFINQINDSGLNVTAGYDSAKGAFTLTNNNTGDNSTISFAGSNAAGMNFLVNQLKMPAQVGTLSIDGSDQGAKDLLTKLNMPATFNSGKATTSTCSVTIPLDPTQTLKSQFSEFATNSGSFVLNMANGSSTGSVTIDPTTDTLNTLLSKINNAGVSATATYDSSTGKVTLKTTNGGSLSFSGSDARGTSFLANTLKLHQAGKDAAFNLDGMDLTESSNNFTIAGVTYNLNGVSPATSITDPTPQKVAISVSNDVEAEVTAVKNLVDAYNKILTNLNSKLDETRYTDYAPLTDDQKASMKDSEITAWNTKAQSGMLHRDSTISSLVDSMRNAFIGSISGLTGKYTNAAAIGLTTSNYMEEGKLHLDETKLRNALTDDPTILDKLFATAGTSTVGADGKVVTSTPTQGIAGRIYDAITTTMDKLYQKAGSTAIASSDVSSTLAKQLTDYTKRIKDVTTRDNDMEDTYYKRFNAMEAALAQLNQQNSTLASMLGTK